MCEPCEISVNISKKSEGEMNIFSYIQFAKFGFFKLKISKVTKKFMSNFLCGIPEELAAFKQHTGEGQNNIRKRILKVPLFCYPCILQNTFYLRGKNGSVNETEANFSLHPAKLNVP